MANNQFIIDAVKGKPNSLTSIAFHTGELYERERIIRIIETKAGHQYEYSLCNCDWCELVYLINDRNVL